METLENLATGRQGKQESSKGRISRLQKQIDLPPKREKKDADGSWFHKRDRETYLQRRNSLSIAGSWKLRILINDVLSNHGYTRSREGHGAHSSSIRNHLPTFLFLGFLQLVGDFDRTSAWRFKDKIDLLKRETSEFGEKHVCEDNCPKVDSDENEIDLGG